MREFELKIEEYMLRQGMLSEMESGELRGGEFSENVGCGILAAVSGGADSTAMLHVLAALKKKYGFPLYAVHVHHGIRQETADRDADFTAALARRLGVPCIIRKVDVPALKLSEKKTLEEAAREARYAILRNEKKRLGFRWIAVAHHGDDQAETVLMHMLRGTGIRGLRGMLPVNEDVIRPFLGTRRREIEAYLDELQESYVTDETNFSEVHARNVIRQRLLPVMLQKDPAVVVNLIRLSLASQQIYRDMERQMDSLAERVGLVEETGRFSFSAGAAEKEPAVFMYEFLLSLFGRLAGGRKDFGRIHAEDTAMLLHKETGKKIMLPGGILARREYDRIILEKTDALPGSSHDLRLRVEILPRGAVKEISKKRYTKMIDYDTIKGNLVLRTPVQGDRIKVLPDGGTRKLSRFFTGQKIPAEQRKSWPVVADGQDILWVVGIRLAEGCKVTPATENIAVLSVEGIFPEHLPEEDTQEPR